jgi:hypothetical protein
MGIRGLFWNGGQRRLRAPWRITATAALLLLAAILFANVGSLLADLLPAGGLGSAGRGLLQATLLLAMVGVTVAVAGLVDRRPAADLGLALTPAWYRECGAGLLVGVAMAASVVVVSLLAGTAVLTGTLLTRDAGLALPGVGPLAATVLWLAFFVGVGALEEVLIRGYLLVNTAEGLTRVLSARRAVVGAVLATALLFGVLHAANPGGTALGVLSISLAGVVFGAAYALTDRLALPVGVHVAWNFTVGPVFGLPVSGLTTSSALLGVQPRGPAVLTGGSFGPEGGLVMLVALAVGVALLAWWIRRVEGGFRLRERLAEPDLFAADPDAE